MTELWQATRTCLCVKNTTKNKTLLIANMLFRKYSSPEPKPNYFLVAIILVVANINKPSAALSGITWIKQKSFLSKKDLSRFGWDLYKPSGRKSYRPMKSCLTFWPPLQKTCSQHQNWMLQKEYRWNIVYYFTGQQKHRTFKHVSYWFY